MPRVLTRSRKRTHSARCVLALTGRRHGDRFRIYVDGTPADLTAEPFRALINLVLARTNGGSGFSVISKNAIYRLRKAIDAIREKGAGAALIGSGEEYRLAIPAKDLQSRVALTPCFFELIGRKMLTQEEADQMRRVCRLCDPAETEKLLDGD